jgi:formylglycine-generating enzyme required for sulfatase activity/uncharacterized caspase-like protein
MSDKYALIIGNTEYADPGLRQLTAPGKDAEEFARILKNKDICAFEHVKVLYNKTSSSMIAAIDEFFDQKKPDDLLVLYYSGHGIRDELGSLYLAAKNTIRSRLRSTALKADYIRDAMDQNRSKRQVVILDCCNSGAFPQGAKAAVGGTMGILSAFQGYGRFVLTASDATQFAWEGDKYIGGTDNSLFTYFLVKGLEGEADYDGDGKITVDELYDYAFDEISKITPNQTPTKSSSKQEGEIILRQNMRIEDAKPVPLPQSLLDAIENPFPDVRLGATRQLVKLLNGKNLGLARSAREALTRIAEEDDSRQVSKAAHQALQEILQDQHSITHRLKQEITERFKIRNAREQYEHLIAQKAEPGRGRGKVDAERTAEAERDQFARPKADARKAAFAEAFHNVNFKRMIPIGGMILSLFLLFFIGKFLVGYLPSTPVPTLTLEATKTLAVSTVSPTFTELPSKTITPTLRPSTKTPTVTLTPTREFSVGTTWLSPKDGMTMMFIPAGEFNMGSVTGPEDEKPIHAVHLEAYWLDKTEVTNAMYAKCMDAGICTLPDSISSQMHSAYYGNAEFDDFPVVNVSWEDARVYCEWRGEGTRLPTEAEWEKAATWDPDQSGMRIFPWGESFSCSFANYWGRDNGCVGDTTKVGNYPWGISFYGLLDMAGNVWEWVADWYDAYPGSKVSNDSYGKDYRVLRGGSWREGIDNIRSANRNKAIPSLANNSIGFRCARSQP